MAAHCTSAPKPYRMTSLGSFAVIPDGAAPLNDVPSRPPPSIRFGAEADAGSAVCPEIERFNSSSALTRPKISSIARKLSSFALSSADLVVGVFARVDPRLRALPNGPLSSGIRVLWLYSVLLANGQRLILNVTRLISILDAICTQFDRACAPPAALHLLFIYSAGHCLLTQRTQGPMATFSLGNRRRAPHRVQRVPASWVVLCVICRFGSVCCLRGWSSSTKGTNAAGKNEQGQPLRSCATSSARPFPFHPLCICNHVGNSAA